MRTPHPPPPKIGFTAFTFFFEAKYKFCIILHIGYQGFVWQVWYLMVGVQLYFKLVGNTFFGKIT